MCLSIYAGKITQPQSTRMLQWSHQENIITDQKILSYIEEIFELGFEVKGRVFFKYNGIKLKERYKRLLNSQKWHYNTEKNVINRYGTHTAI